MDSEFSIGLSFSSSYIYLFIYLFIVNVIFNFIIKVTDIIELSKTIVIKPGPARRVDPVAGPVRVCQKTGRCNDPAKPRSTRWVNP